MIKKILISNIILLSFLYTHSSQAERISFSNEQAYHSTMTDLNKTIKLNEAYINPKTTLKDFNDFEYSKNDFIYDKKFFTTVLSKDYYPFGGSKKNKYPNEMSVVTLHSYMKIYIKYKDLKSFESFNNSNSNKFDFDKENTFYSLKYYSVTGGANTDLIEKSLNYLLNHEGLKPFYLNLDKHKVIFSDELFKKAYTENTYNSWMNYYEADKDFINFIEQIKQDEIPLNQQKQFFKILRFYKQNLI